MIHALLFILAIFPNRSGYVNDLSHALKPESRALIENQLMIFEKEEGVQFIVAVVPALDGRSIRDVSQEYFVRWQIGHNGRDSGMLLLLSVQDASSYIDLGYGLEQGMNEQVALEISEKVINPLLAKGDVDGALKAAVQAIFTAFEFTPEKKSSSSFLSNPALWMFLLSVPLLYMVARFAPTRLFFLSPTIGFALGYTQSLGLGVAIAALGIVMVVLSYILKHGAFRR
jgi:uncharacterized membrane protein YgcG